MPNKRAHKKIKGTPQTRWTDDNNAIAVYEWMQKRNEWTPLREAMYH